VLTNQTAATGRKAFELEQDQRLILEHSPLTKKEKEELTECIKFRDVVANELPLAYVQLYNNVHRRQKNQSKTFVEESWKILRPKYDPFECWAIIEADCFLAGWSPRLIYLYKPSEVKDPLKQYAGRVSAKARAFAAEVAALEQSKKRHVGLSNADPETRERVAKIGGDAKLEPELSKAGKIGGESTKELYGQEFYDEIQGKAKGEVVDDIPADEVVERETISIKLSIEQLVDTIEQAKEDGHDMIEIESTLAGNVVGIHTFTAVTKELGA